MVKSFNGITDNYTVRIKKDIQADKCYDNNLVFHKTILARLYSRSPYALYVMKNGLSLGR